MPASPIPRHKTAIRRGDLSRPVKWLLRDGLLDRGVSLFDSGCGRGEDLELLTVQGIACSGWDSTYRPDAPQAEADVVNLGYVLNVIEAPQERTATLRRAWALCRRLLVASAQVVMDGRGKAPVPFGGGVMTGRGTFQKFFEQGELAAYLEAELGVAAVSAAPGVFYLFRDEAERETFALVRRVTGDEVWEAAGRRRTEDLLVCLALSRFRRRQALAPLPRTLQADLRAFFGGYAAACRQADELLFRAGDADAIDATCKRSPVGKAPASGSRLKSGGAPGG
jgi:hypothetical protein